MATDAARQRLQLRISGRVQGVNFRTLTQARAVALGLVGWVQNLPDGRVQVVVEGPAARLQELLEWCYSGVANARVDAVDAQWSVATGEDAAFTIRGW